MCSKPDKTRAEAFVDIFVISLSLALAGLWLLGFVLAKGFWSTLFCWIPFYSWYLVLEHFFFK